MADRSLHCRTQSVSCLLTQDEHRQLRAICEVLRLSVRDILLIGVRRAKARLAEEQWR